jgi:iron(III) transport system substrate-binding protein
MARLAWVAGLIWLGGVAGCSGGGAAPRVVLYCAQDQEFADPVFEDFRQRTGLAVAPKFDTEAKKSVSLYAELVGERDRPRCDVFWNNEVLGTIRLARQNLLEPYDSPSAAPYPASTKAPDHAWHAFAARARVLLVNTNLVKEADRPRRLAELTDARWRGRAVIAVPLYGTSFTHAACLFEVLGPDRAKDFYRGLKANEVQLAPGNKQVAEWVGQGRTPAGRTAAVGLTDTDDAMAEVAAGRDVAVVFPDGEPGGAGDRMGTLFIPNTLAVIKGGPNPDGARRLVDHLLSAEVEAKLAESDGHQIPLNPEVKARLPGAMQAARTAQPMRVDFGKAADLWDDVRAFLTEEFAAP